MAAPNTPDRDQRILGDGTAMPGLTLSNINPAVLAEYGLPLGATGVVVDDPGPIGARFGLRVGDLLRVVNGDTVNGTDDVEKALTGRLRRVVVDVQRGLQRLVISARI